MSPFGDDPFEMPRNQPFDDDAIEALLAGTTHDESLADLASFVTDVRKAGEAVPNPSPALAAALASGLSIDKGDLPATAASNVHGPAPQAAGLPKWRRLRMKIQGFLAGLGVAGKVALGASLAAAAATTGAGAAGVLPPSVQHVVATTVSAVTPFNFPDGDSGGGSGNSADGAEVTTTTSATTTSEPEVTTSVPHETSTSAPGAHDGHGDGSGDGVILPAPTTEHHGDGGSTETTTPTTEHNGDGSGDGGGTSESTTTPTTDHHDPTTTTAPHDGDSNNPQSLSIECSASHEPNHISCHWTPSTSSEHAHYVLIRMTTGNTSGTAVMESADALEFVDTGVTSSTGYGYRVISLRGDGTVESHSNVATLMCCGA
jgi:hypothetical protein